MLFRYKNISQVSSTFDVKFDVKEKNILDKTNK